MKKLLLARDIVRVLAVLAVVELLGRSTRLTLPPPLHHHSLIANLLANELLGVVVCIIAGLAGLALWGAYIIGYENLWVRYHGD